MDTTSNSLGNETGVSGEPAHDEGGMVNYDNTPIKSILTSDGGSVSMIFIKEVDGNANDEATEDAVNKLEAFNTKHPEIVKSWEGQPFEICKAQAVELEPNLFK